MDPVAELERDSSGVLPAHVMLSLIALWPVGPGGEPLSDRMIRSSRRSPWLRAARSVAAGVLRSRLGLSWPSVARLLRTPPRCGRAPSHSMCIEWGSLGWPGRDEAVASVWCLSVRTACHRNRRPVPSTVGEPRPVVLPDDLAAAMSPLRAAS
ncbi:MAG: hypothetical protein AAGF47_08055 [Planctomycetota bacterium]